MEPLYATVVGVLVAAGVYLTLRARIFPVLLGISLLSYAVNLFLFASGRLTLDSAPLANLPQVEYPDPLPQALVLTAIVIGFGMSAFLVVLAMRAYGEEGSEHVDGAAGERLEAEEAAGEDEETSRRGDPAGGVREENRCGDPAGGVREENRRSDEDRP